MRALKPSGHWIDIGGDGPAGEDGHVRSPAPLASGIAPFRQGDLDGLCGLYALINAVRILCPEVHRDMANLIFATLISGLPLVGLRVDETIFEGTTTKTMKTLATMIVDILDVFCGVTIQSSSLQRPKGCRDSDTVWNVLRSHLDQRCVAIIGLSGIRDHWTVAASMSERTIRLCDSSSLKILRRAHFSVARDATPYRIKPKTIIVLRRADAVR